MKNESRNLNHLLTDKWFPGPWYSHNQNKILAFALKHHSSVRNYISSINSFKLKKISTFASKTRIIDQLGCKKAPNEALFNGLRILLILCPKMFRLI